MNEKCQIIDTHVNFNNNLNTNYQFNNKNHDYCKNDFNNNKNEKKFSQESNIKLDDQCISGIINDNDNSSINEYRKLESKIEENKFEVGLNNQTNKEHENRKKKDIENVKYNENIKLVKFDEGDF